MNLYRIEYTFNQDAYNADLETNSVPEAWVSPKDVFNTLPTHLLAQDFFSACEKAKTLVNPNPYLLVDRIIHLETNINLLP